MKITLAIIGICLAVLSIIVSLIFAILNQHDYNKKWKSKSKTKRNNRNGKSGKRNAGRDTELNPPAN